MAVNLNNEPAEDMLFQEVQCADGIYCNDHPYVKLDAGKTFVVMFPFIPAGTELDYNMVVWAKPDGPTTGSGFTVREWIDLRH